MNVLIILSLFILGQSVTAESITIGTFNIHKPEAPPSSDRPLLIAQLCKGIDLLALQEVDETGNEVEQIARWMGEDYQFAVSEVTLHERFAFIWRSPVVAVLPPVFAPGLDLGRKPYLGFFKAGQFDFQLLNVHLFWEGSKKTYPHTRGIEIRLLDDWLIQRKSKELDLILIGDFNEPHSFYGYNPPPPRSPHEDFYEMLVRHQIMSVSLDLKKPTSIVNQNIFDHLIFNPSKFFTSEYMGLEFVRVIDWEKDYDSNKNGVLEYSEYDVAKQMVADHRIVTAKFSIDGADDDDEADADQ